MPARKRSSRKQTRKQTGRTARRRSKAETRKSSKTTTTPASDFQLSDREVERLLQTGENRGMLEVTFGEAEYAELTELAQQAASRSVRGGPRVLILPGIMGSMLGTKRKTFGHDTLWIDPVDIALGNLVELALPDRKKVEALGVWLPAYLKLKLRLGIAGFDADFHPFDWRRSLDVLGRELLARVKSEPAERLHIVAHSMGGLVARAALAAEGRQKKIERFIMLGTPNFGSFVPVQAVRATYSMVTSIATLDLKHSAEDLARKIFRTLPGLAQMLPSPRKWSGIDLYDPASWPSDRPAPDARLLRGAVAVQDGLAPADERFHLIAGVNQATTTGLSLADGRFEYEETKLGDGTVPLDFALLPGAKTFYVEEQHGGLANNRTVCRAVVDLLSTGETSQLPSQHLRRRSEARRTLSEAEVERSPFEGLKPQEFGPREYRMLLEPFVSPESHERAALPGSTQAPGPGYEHSFDNVVVERRRQHSIDLRLALGSVTEVDARALALGLFRDVEPAGAAGAIDELLGGAVKEFTTRRMFSGEVGDIFVMPTGRGRVRAEAVLFAGLGPFDGFGPEVQEFAMENVVRTFVRTHVEDFATVLMGGGSGKSVGIALYHQLRGIVRGLIDADTDHRIRRVTICEFDPDRYAEIKRELFRLTSTSLFDDVRVTLDEVHLPEPAPPPQRRAGLVARANSQLAYLIVGQIENAEVVTKDGKLKVGKAGKRTHVDLRASVLTATAKATVLAGERRVALSAITSLQKKIEKQLDAAGLVALGHELAELCLEPKVAQALASMKDYHLVVIHDEAEAARLPWEILRIGNWAPAAEQGLSRRYSAKNLSVAKWLEERRVGRVLDMLLVVNPTGDLDGTEDEADRIKELFPAHAAVRLKEIRGVDATRRTLLREFSSGEYDVIHYAGHAYFDEERPSRSGIICAGDEVLSGAQLAGLSHLPALVFFNACEAGRTRKRRGAKRGDDPTRRKDVAKRIESNVGLAEAFLRGGVANYIGTYWPVGDRAAEAFASTFYAKLVEGDAIGPALQQARKAVRATGSIDWADYIHYGSYDFVVKKIEQGD